MRGGYIAFDLETTGLDAASDEIIEIGIARFVDGELVDQYQSLVKPSIPIPREITHLTGIDSEDVEDQPPIQELVADIASLSATCPLSLIMSNLMCHFCPSIIRLPGIWQ